jgi:hypothetical protein
MTGLFANFLKYQDEKQTVSKLYEYFYDSYFPYSLNDGFDEYFC